MRDICQSKAGSSQSPEYQFCDNAPSQWSGKHLASTATARSIRIVHGRDVIAVSGVTFDDMSVRFIDATMCFAVPLLFVGDTWFFHWTAS